MPLEDTLHVVNGKTVKVPILVCNVSELVLG